MKRPEKRTRHFNISMIVVAVVAIGGLLYALVDVSAHPGRFAAGYHDGDRGDHGIARLCADDRDARLGALLAYVEGTVGVTADQADAWSQLEAVMRAGSATLVSVCADIERPNRSAPDMMALAEVAMAAGVDALREVRPALDTFYGTLSSAQREIFDGLMSRRHGG